MSDIFGLFDNNLLLADEFAKSGYLTIVPDLFNGDQVPADALESGKFDLQSWLPKHVPNVTDPIVSSTLKHIREALKIESVGAVGYCYGAIVSPFNSLVHIIMTQEKPTMIPVRQPLLEIWPSSSWL